MAIRLSALDKPVVSIKWRSLTGGEINGATTKTNQGDGNDEEAQKNNQIAMREGRPIGKPSAIGLPVIQKL